MPAKPPLDTPVATIYRVLNRFCEDEIVRKIVLMMGNNILLSVKCDDATIPANHFHFR
ncbi:MAG TPA: hypothetical protein VN722_05405 [Hanamia sp.]|nr:hypothetical protein [Hanamia sp.]